MEVSTEEPHGAASVAQGFLAYYPFIYFLLSSIFLIFYYYNYHNLSRSKKITQVQ
jgi:hypothetical protein